METNKETVENNVVIDGTGNVDTQSTNKTEDVKTFTQEEVNAMLKKEKLKTEKKYEGIDIAKYNEWVESQKSAEQKQAEREAEYQKTLSVNEALAQENKVLKAGVGPDDVDYIVFKVSKMEGNFEENLSSYLKDNPKYIQKEETKETKPQTTGFSQNKANVVVSDNQAYLDKKYANNPYYKK